jgi:hypothetical protein
MFKSSLTALDVARGVSRLLLRMNIASIAEFPLGSGRRADLAGLCDKGQISLVEIKISLADLRSDEKWQTYLDYCDRFYFAVPQGFPLDVLSADPGVGIIVADAHDAAIIREGSVGTLPGSRRKAETLRFARRAASRLQLTLDPAASGTGWL